MVLSDYTNILSYLGRQTDSCDAPTVDPDINLFGDAKCQCFCNSGPVGDAGYPLIDLELLMWEPQFEF